jgi:hypothetical protein
VDLKCCNKRLTPYRKDYGPGGFEEGFRCRKCGRIRVPVKDSIEGFSSFIPLTKEQEIVFSENLREENDSSLYI